MSSIIVKNTSIVSSDKTMLEAGKNIISNNKQLSVETNHIIHGGMYSRTIKMNAGEALAGAVIKVPTLLLVNGNVNVLIGKEVVNITDTRLIPASKDREQLIYAVEDSSITMIMPTNLTTVEEIEDSYTDSSKLLMSRHSDAINNILISGE